MRWAIPMQHEPRIPNELQASAVAMQLDLRRRVGDIGENRMAMLDDAAVERSPRFAALVKDSVPTNKFDPIAGATPLPALFVPRQPGRWRHSGARSRPDDLRSWTNRRNNLVRDHL